MNIDELIKNTLTVAIFGHVRPDGDCVGSTLALFNYISDNYPSIKVDIFLEAFPECFKILHGTKDAKKTYNPSTNPIKQYDIAFLFDTPSFERVGANGLECIQNAKKTCNIDHHISNPLNLCHFNIVDSSASSASEVLYTQLNEKKLTKNAANCLYLGIVHDTGAFKFSCTRKQTMQIVGELIEKEIDFSRIVNDTYYTRTYKQTLVTGFVMQRSKLALNGKVVYSYIDSNEMKNFDITPVELSNVIDTIREVSGTEVALFIYPVNDNFKISLRSNYFVDVNSIAKEFGGGGHIRAAGANTTDAPLDAIEKILKLIEKQL